MSLFRIALAGVAATAFAIAAATAVPRGLESWHLLTNADDPAVIADHALDKRFDGNVAAAEIESALTAKDAELAASFVELAQERGVAVDAALVARVAAAVEAEKSAANSATRFARGLVTGEPDDLSSLAGTALGDLFVFGDIRDAVREGSRLASGQEADQLILGLACVGLAVTAGTYASLGIGAPARVGLSLVKAARKTGHIGADMAGWMGRSLRASFDWSNMKQALTWASLTQPAVAVRTAREAVKIDKAGGLVRLVSDVGTIQGKAGTRAAMDGLKLAKGPQDVARVAKLASKKGGKTRAILKTTGRGALTLGALTFNLGSWVMWAMLTLFGLCASIKNATERMTERHLRKRKARRARLLARDLLDREQRAMLAAA